MNFIVFNVTAFCYLITNCVISLSLFMFIAWCILKRENNILKTMNIACIDALNKDNWLTYNGEYLHVRIIIIAFIVGLINGFLMFYYFFIY